MQSYTKLQPIRPYVAPQYLVELNGDEITDQSEVDDEIGWADYVEGLMQNPQGWGDYQEIIGVVYPDETRYYLAQIEEEA